MLTELRITALLSGTRYTGKYTRLKRTSLVCSNTYFSSLMDSYQKSARLKMVIRGSALSSLRLVSIEA